MAERAQREPVQRLRGRILVVGGDVAGLLLALALAPRPVTIITDQPLATRPSTNGTDTHVRSLLGTGGSPDDLARDVIAAGAGLVDETVATLVAGAARRIDDATVLDTAIDRVRRAPSIDVLEGYAVEAPIMDGTAITGAVFGRDDDPAARYRLEGASAVVLATGGVAGLFGATGADWTQIGVGLAIAARAGAAIADAEFVRFPSPVEDDDAVAELDWDGMTHPMSALFHVGGVKTDVDGHTIVPNLWAVGEAASIGLHGADGMAGAVLLEALVVSARAAAALSDAATTAGPSTADDGPAAMTLSRVRADHLVDAAARETAIRIITATLTRHAGRRRTADGLTTALETLDIVDAGADGDLGIENAVMAARFIVEAALRRKESRGVHVRTDHPRPVDRLARRSSITLTGLSLRATAAAQMAAVVAATRRTTH